MIWQAHSPFLQVHSQIAHSHTVPSRREIWIAILFYFIYYCCYWELDENDAHIGKFVMPQISLCMELNHTNTLGDPFACQPGNLKALSEFVLALCKIMVQSWVCVWCWFTLSSPTIRNIISPFGAWWARHAEPDWSPGAAGATNVSKYMLLPS